MANSAPRLMWINVLAIALSISVANCLENYVSPSDVTCQMEPCLTFNQYGEDDFTSDAVFMFLPGTHNRNTSLTISGVQNITLQGTALSTITLNPQVSLLWENCEMIEIISLEFSFKGGSNFRLKFVNSFSILFQKVVISGANTSAQNDAVETVSSDMIIRDSTFSQLSGTVGAALYLTSSKITLQGNNMFLNCTSYLGGAIYTRNSTIHVEQYTLLANNTAVRLDGTNDNLPYYDSGLAGAVFSDNSTIIITGTLSFVGNEAATLGGAVVTVNNSTLVTENDSLPGLRLSFNRNSVLAEASSAALLERFDSQTRYGAGGALYTEDSEVGIANAVFENNKSPGGGGAVQFNQSSVQISNITMNSNRGLFGGGLRSINTTFTMHGVNRFDNNNAYGAYGGALLIEYADSPTIHGENYFSNNLAKDYGGALDFYRAQLAMVDGINNFTFNKAEHGGAIAIYNSSVNFYGENYFMNNEARSHSGAINIETSVGTFDATSSSIFHNNTAQLAGGSMASYDSQLNLDGKIKFESNRVELGVGGAMALYGTTQLQLNTELNAEFSGNGANSFGGAIYYADSLSSAQCSVNARPPECYLTFNFSYSSLNDSSLLMNFTGNWAGEGGDVLYGGNLNKCQLLFEGDTAVDECGNRIRPAVQYQESLLDIVKAGELFVQQDNNFETGISSLAERVCVCDENSTILCDIESTFMTQSVMPGEKFTLSIVALGQNSHSVKATILSKNVNSDSNYELGPAIQSTQLTCTEVSYRLYASAVPDDATVLYRLFLDGPCQSLVVNGVDVHLSILPCPIGFMLSTTDYECVCEQILDSLTGTCFIDNQSIYRPENNFWIAIDSINDTHNGFLLHNGSCPLDYCTEAEINVTLDNSNVQCNTGRQGVLCGSCAEGFSLALGSLHCITCSNAYISLFVVFAVAGIVLIFVLFVLRITVADGTINGLIFYANIVQANQQAFFPRATINFFTVFLSWLNLDLGIETCLYDGLSIYVYSWLQFLFPLYLWFLIAIIIVGCHYSQTLSRAIGHNPIAVLDTILLLSYSKILKAIIVPLSPTTLVRYPDNHIDTVWLYDADISYFLNFRHCFLGIFSIFALLFLFLPYTFLLLFGQWIQAISHWRHLSWINRLKPFLDAYYAPYRTNKRYWLGLFLLARCVLFTTFAFNAVGDFSINLLLVCSIVAGLSILRGQIYNKAYNDILESSFILNLCIFSVATFYVLEEVPSGDQYRVQYALSAVSVSITFITFIGIVAFHTYRQLKKVDILSIFDRCLLKRRSHKDTVKDSGIKVVTKSSVSLRELLLESEET